MPNAKVALIRCHDYNNERIGSAIEKQFELLGGIDKFVKKGDRVLLKPNFIMARSRKKAAQTDPAVIIETAKLVKDFGAKPFVGDSPAWGSIDACLKALKLDGPLKEMGVPVYQLNDPKRKSLTATSASVSISSLALETDAIINLPKFKSHQQLGATFAVKNMFGCVTGKQKAYWHFAKGASEEEFCELLIEIFKLLSPAITIIDGVTAMDGPGPIRGRARKLGWLIAGADPIACEAVCAKLIDFEEHDLPIIKTARKLMFGCPDFEKIEIAGERLPDTPCSDFERAIQMPIKFSLLKVCKSIAKQILIRLRAR